MVVSYSDGEGSDAGFGVAIWSQGAPPLAAFMEVPTVVRDLWTRQRMTTWDEYRDIYEIEAIGPVMVLHLWPQLLKRALWIHFIDNSAAQASLVKGSSSVQSGDVIVGHTWQLVADLQANLWVERVHTKSNPVDGLSRRRFEGPWASVIEATFPEQLVRELRALKAAR